MFYTVNKTLILDVLILEPTVFGDSRMFSLEYFSAKYPAGSDFNQAEALN
jgi:hypothetical protein